MATTKKPTARKRPQNPDANYSLRKRMDMETEGMFYGGIAKDDKKKPTKKK